MNSHHSKDHALSVPTTVITEHQIKALVVYMDAFPQDARARLPEGVSEAVVDLQQKLEFANDGLLRLSGRTRIIDIKRDEEVGHD